MSSGLRDATFHFLDCCKDYGISEVRIIANVGCSHDKSYDFYFAPRWFFAIKVAANRVGAKLGEYQNIEEGCVTLLGVDFDEGDWRLEWVSKEIKCQNESL